MFIYVYSAEEKIMFTHLHNICANTLWLLVHHTNETLCDGI